MNLDDLTTVLIPTSPIPAHPSTEMIERCIDSVRKYFPSAQMYVMADGVRPQIENRRAQYQDYVHNLFDRQRDGRFGRCEIRVFPDFSQQAIMTRRTLEGVERPLVLFVEHDVTLRQEPALNFNAIASIIMSGTANMVRLYHWEKIWHEHVHLMRGEIEHDGVKFVKTVQYSQWPNMGSLDYYRRILSNYFQPTQRNMIETVMYGPVVGAPWEQNKIVIYAPENMDTFVHMNGRVDERSGVRDPGDW